MSLFLTNIDRFATEKEVECMVRRSVGIEMEEEINVIKLVPKWKNVSLLDYASFRVVLDIRWKTVVMNSDTWPTGIKFREFVSTRSKTVAIIISS